MFYVRIRTQGTNKTTKDCLPSFGLLPLPDSDSDSGTDSCTMQVLWEYYVAIGFGIRVSPNVNPSPAVEISHFNVIVSSHWSSTMTETDGFQERFSVPIGHKNRKQSVPLTSIITGLGSPTVSV